MNSEKCILYGIQVIINSASTCQTNINFNSLRFKVQVNMFLFFYFYFYFYFYFFIFSRYNISNWNSYFSRIVTKGCVCLDVQKYWRFIIQAFHGNWRNCSVKSTIEKVKVKLLLSFPLGNYLCLPSFTRLVTSMYQKFFFFSILIQS